MKKISYKKLESVNGCQRAGEYFAHSAIEEIDTKIKTLEGENDIYSVKPSANVKEVTCPLCKFNFPVIDGDKTKERTCPACKETFVG